MPRAARSNARGPLAAVLIGLCLAACGPIGEPPKPFSLESVGFDRLEGWNAGGQTLALSAFLRSCAALMRLPDARPVGTDAVPLTAGHFKPACAAARDIGGGGDIAARRFFEVWFTPYRVVAEGSDEGLFTGYYEAELRGAWTRGGPYQVPIYARPKDLVTVSLGRFDSEWRGKTVAGRVANGTLEPYASRADIDRGALANKGLEVLWVDDPVDAFFLHVQGSGRVRMADSTVTRLGFAGHNGHTYVSIGRRLIERGALEKGSVTMASIRSWIAANPDKGAALLAENPRYVFFRVMQGDGPLGAQGVALTAGASLAVDRTFVPLGAPVWLDTTDPLNRERPLRRLLVAQDTGGAIQGAVRGDVFWGWGGEAARRAGAMQERGRYFLLLPRTAAPAPGA